MAFIPHKDIHVGDIVKLLEPVTVYNGVFETGTIVEVIDKTDDGFRISDEEGHTASGVDHEKLAVVKSRTLKYTTDEPAWLYETGKEIPEILGSGSDYHNVQHTKSEDEAFRLFRDGTRNYLIRYKLIKGRHEKQEGWDEHEKKWIKYY